MKNLSIKELIVSAKSFCSAIDGQPQKDLFGVTDGKAVGTYVEHLFQDFLSSRYKFTIGCSAKGLDLPSVNTDIKVTSITQPQSSCPFENSKQKIYGLGYNLIVFVYKKHDDNKRKVGVLNFCACTFIDAKRTADYQTTTGILNILRNNGNDEDIFAYLTERNIPGDEITLMNIAKDIVKNPPLEGYLTISNALQWRLQYGRVVSLNNSIEGVTNIIPYENE